MKNLVIIGVGGFAREVYWHAQSSIGFETEWQIKGFLDGDVKLSAEDYAKLPMPVLGDIDSYEISADDVFTCAIGTPQIRRKLIEKILGRGGNFINIISKNTFVVPTAKIGRGVIFAFGVGISDYVEIGDFTVINNFSGVGHDSKIGRFSCLMSFVNVAGNAQVGDEVFVASNALIAPKAKVGSGAFIGAGSVVLKNVRAGAKVFGNPALEI